MQIGYFLENKYFHENRKNNITYYMDHCKIEMQNASVIQEDKVSKKVFSKFLKLSLFIILCFIGS